MRSDSDALRSRRRVPIASVIAQLAGPSAVAASLYAWSLVGALAADGFIVPPDGAARLPGPVGQEANFAEILATREQTGGVLGVWRYTAGPESGPPLHVHTEEDEAFYVLSGEFAIQLGDCVEVAPAGSFVFIPKDAAHTYRNMRTQPGELLGIATPGGLEGLFEALQGVDAETAEELIRQHAMFSVGPPIDLAALEAGLAASKRAAPTADGYRIGILAPGCDPPSPLLQTFLQALAEAGYAEGQNIAIEWRYSQGNAENFAGLAVELSRLDVDVIVAVSTPAALAAKQVSKLRHLRTVLAC
jgi:mannose-6-phosphate isomerase-like protein (cupin superfamily)